MALSEGRIRDLFLEIEVLEDSRDSALYRCDELERELARVTAERDELLRLIRGEGPPA